MFEENKLVGGNKATNLLMKASGVPVKVLAGFADWIGLGDEVRKFAKAGMGLDEDQAQSVVRKLVNKALAKKNVDISQLQQKLDALPFSIPVDLRDKVSNYRQKVNDKINNIELDKAAIEIAGLEAEQLAHEAERSANMATQTEKLQAVEQKLADVGITE